MAKPLVPLTIAAPGFLGLNTQQAGSILPPGWATKLDNFVYDDVGRIAARNGSEHRHATVVTSSPTIEAAHEYIDASGNKALIFAADNKIWKEVTGTITNISGTITTPTGNDWQFANFNGRVVGYQSGHAPIEMLTTGGTFVDATGTMQNGSMVLSAFGRTWTVVGNILYHSDLLIHSYAGGTSGNFDLSNYWPNGMDTAVALAEFNGLLVVFGKESLIIYESPDVVSTMAIVEGIDGIGCIARDSVQVVGNELVFLSSTGLRSLARTVLQKSNPLSDISTHVRDDLLNNVAAETPVKIKSVYNKSDGFYLLSLPNQGLSYMFDLKFPNADKTWKVAKWLIAPTALVYTEGLEMILAVENGWLSEYKGFKDNVLSSGTGGVTYQIDFEGVWNDFGEEVADMFKILKTVDVLAAGTSSSTVNFKWAVDYSNTFTQRLLTFQANAPSRFGIAQFGIGTFSASGDFERVKAHLARVGQVVKPGLITTIDGVGFAIQRMDLLAKIGRLGL